MERRPAGGDIEGVIGEREMVGVGRLQEDVGEPTAADVPPQGDGFAHPPRESRGHHSSANVEDAVAGLRPHEGGQPSQSLRVGYDAADGHGYSRAALLKAAAKRPFCDSHLESWPAVARRRSR